LNQGVRLSASRYAAALSEDLPDHDPVEWMIIRRMHGQCPTPEGEDPRVVRVDDYAQAAALLRGSRFIPGETFAKVVRAVRAAGGGREPLRPLESRAERLPALDETRSEVAALDEEDA
jgi:hypothetical protein